MSFEDNEITCRNIDENLSKTGGCQELTYYLHIENLKARYCYDLEKSPFLMKYRAIKIVTIVVPHSLFQ